MMNSKNSATKLYSALHRFCMGHDDEANQDKLTVPNSINAA
jgi:hypothetical protein